MILYEKSFTCKLFKKPTHLLQSISELADEEQTIWQILKLKMLLRMTIWH